MKMIVVRLILCIGLTALERKMDQQLSQWLHTNDRDRDAISLYCRHYSRKRYTDGRANLLTKGFVGPGEKMVLITAAADALFVWRYSIFDHKNGRKGVYCSIFRNEGSVLSSKLIREAVKLAKERWPGQKLFTYVNAGKIRSTNPGYCFLKAGWHRAGMTQGGLHILDFG